MMKKQAVRKGIAIRVDVTEDELREFRIYALKRKSSVPKLIAEHIRAALARNRKP